MNSVEQTRRSQDTNTPRDQAEGLQIGRHSDLSIRISIALNMTSMNEFGLRSLTLTTISHYLVPHSIQLVVHDG